MFAIRTVALLFFSLPSTAFAHTGVGDTHGVIHGFMHPLTGIDHILAMIAVGLIAAHLGGRALWLVPASFVTVMASGGAVGAAGFPLPFVETGIACSVIALGLMTAFEVRLPTAAVMALVGFFAIFHGHAHGTELPENAAGSAYGFGFLAATALLHALGLGAGLLLRRFADAGGPTLMRLSGGVISMAGIVLALKLL